MVNLVIVLIDIIISPKQFESASVKSLLGSAYRFIFWRQNLIIYGNMHFIVSHYAITPKTDSVVAHWM